MLVDNVIVKFGDSCYFVLCGLGGLFGVVSFGLVVKKVCEVFIVNIKSLFFLVFS